MDKLRATPFTAGLLRLLAESLQDGEQVVWQGQPDAIANATMWRFLWWIGFPWLLLTVIAVSNDWIDQATQPLAMIGVGMIAAPFVMLLQDLQTLYVITDRRALIVRTAWSRRSVTATSFDAMDEVFEILDIGGGVGHLNFASGRSTRSPDTDYTGRYGFRCVRDARRIRDILDHARTGKVRRSHAGRTAASTGSARRKA
ncbi:MULTISPECIES: hypothetical protein [unclassified Bradyrhizobium]|uniref:hypothetical protein n=1 Tax=Bradyrhizobium TaxID=374 RepID=UPI001CD3A6CF|nr:MULTISPECIES: hypothetical protein [unclassified Bradyrhizobium]MCA1362513.1 hypothetical protein [Bradyrhizobium sp. IC4059]MCA1496970.1 hypothetical protein [Bradyrhizobium sp. NBAIM14]MCA1519911.1 hypothetical protein [Bradyrhizobium sp. IC3069]MCA1534058.1 hypothetical protein [Bradyrhizobium sp. NBAIM03]MCA1543597.1 hypothetical protein [Bradyrhizobium sp. NBAIM32]